MRRFVALLLFFVLWIAQASAIDLSGMSLAELVDLKEQVTLAMWETEDWQEVTVPQGLYKIGEDIPAGHWAFAIADIGGVPVLKYGNKLEGNKKEVSYKGNIYYAEQLRGPDSGKYYDTYNSPSFIGG